MKKIFINKQIFIKYKLLLKIKISIILILYIKFWYNKYLIIYNYKNYIPKNLKWAMPEKDKLYNLLNLKNKPTNLHDSLIIKEKKELLYKISKFIKKKIISIEYIYLKGKLRFGNFLVTLNNAIFLDILLQC